MRFLNRLDELLGEPQLLLPRHLITILFAAFFKPYAWLGVLLCYAGFMLPVVLEYSPASWAIAIPSLSLGFLCLIRYLNWRDRGKQANKIIGRGRK